MVKRDGWILKHKKTGDPVAVGEKITDHRGIAAYVCGGVPPETKRGQGTVATALSVGGIEFDYYPKIYDLVWKHEGPATELDNHEARGMK